MRQILAMGGGGFSMEPDNLALDEYALRQTGKTCPSVCFLPTASGDSDTYIVKFYAALTQLDCRPSHLSLFKPPQTDLEAYILEKDVIYVGGGHTRNMLTLWREWGLDRILRTAWNRGVLVAGISAGAICWFEQGLSDSVGGLGALNCLGLLPGSCCPHYDGEEQRRPVYHRLILEGELLPGFGVDDGAALHFVDEHLKCVVTSRLEARAYVVEVVAGDVRERSLEPTYLLEPDGSKGSDSSLVASVSTTAGD
jgi:dipeptidase E